MRVFAALLALKNPGGVFVLTVLVLKNPGRGFVLAWSLSKTLVRARVERVRSQKPW